MANLTINLGSKTTWKRGCLWTLGLLTSGGLCLAAILWFTSYQQGRELRNSQENRRSAKKIRLGDDIKTVRIRLGVPDTAIADVTTIDGQKITAWFYRNDATNIFNNPNLILFYPAKDTKVVRSIFFGPLLEGFLPWVPEDGLTPNAYSNADNVVQQFTAALGRPCAETLSDDSTSVWYYFRLSSRELAADSIYQRKTATEDKHFPFRVLQIDLKGGKKVSLHGWSETEAGKSLCTANPKP
jgi:hypothetical protein